MSDFRQELLAAFDVEHKEHLQAIRHALDAAAAGAAVDVKDVFRRAHSLKGAARAVDLPVVEELAHRLETLFAQVLDQSSQLDHATIGVVQLGLDAIEGYVAALTVASEPPPPQAALQALSRLVEASGQLDPDPNAPMQDGTPAEAAVDLPPGAPTEYLRIAAAQVDHLSGTVHGLTAELQRQDGLLLDLQRLQVEARALGRHWENVQRQAGISLPDRSAGTSERPGVAALRPLETQLRHFDRDLKSLLRTVISLARQQREAKWELEQAAQQVREGVERISLVTAEVIFGSLGRMVRELARAEGREVDLHLIGLDLQADRRVLQTLKDPVMHLLRNALGHAAETEPERMARGKPARPEIGLALESRDGRLTVRVYDDGPGPDLTRIEQVAAQRGLLPVRDGAMPRLLPDQLLSLVFEPGFSTAAEVGRLAGRGMGLSVVAEAARRLRGTAMMRSRAPWGTEVVVSVPFSAGRQPVLLVEAAGQVCGLPSYGVDRLLRLSATMLSTVEGGIVTLLAINGQDLVVPVVPLAALTGSSDAALPVEGGLVKAVLLRGRTRHCAVAVTEFLDVRTLLVEEAQEIGLDDDLVAGLALLEGDMPTLVLSPEALVERWARDKRRLAASGLGLTQPTTQRPQATILVVDDSITTRSLEKSILEAQGYRVLLSVDGLDALERLRAGDAVIDLVVADIEMPRMDGFALLQAIKNDARLASLPVILMTSRASPEDVRRGLELGAGGYITKQKFDQRELLAMIGQML